jgi:hypothetical protein
MPRYECPECNKVFCGWAVEYKYKNKCPLCGGELKEVFSNNSNNQDFRKSLIAKIFKIRERNGLRKNL